MRRAKYFMVTAEMLARFVTENDVLTQCIHGVPRGSRVLGAHWDILRDAFLVAVEHPSFPEVKEGSLLTEFRPVFKEYRA
jgi:hypothetical protein